MKKKAVELTGKTKVLLKLLICAMLIGVWLLVPTAFAADYDASKAVAYARMWSGAEKQADCPHGSDYVWCHCGYNNSQYYAYTSSNKYGEGTEAGPKDVDCANFVSQCLHTGGLPMDGTWYVNSNKMGSKAWVNGYQLSVYLVETLGYTGYTSSQISIDNIAVGDVVYTKRSTSGSHTLIVSKVENGQVYCCAHTKNNKDVAYDPSKLVYHVAMQGSDPEPNPPVIESVTLTNQSASGYRVVAQISDDSGLQQVYFPTWNSKKHDTTLKWLAGTRGENNTWYADVLFANHGGETNVTYITHVYATDAWGNQSVKAKNVHVENTAPEISDVRVTAISSTGFTVSATVKDASAIKTVYFPTWSTGSAKWFAGVKTGDKVWSADISFAECGSLVSDKFYTHVYATDVWDNVAKLEKNNYYLDYTAPIIEEITLTNQSASGYRVVAKISDANGISKVQFPTWNHTAQESTIKWLEGVKGDGNTWYADVVLANHGGATNCTYITHIYATNTLGFQTVEPKNVRVENNAPVISDIRVTAISREGFTVTATIEDASELKTVYFPTWSTGTAKWYSGTKVSENEWSADISFEECGSLPGDRFYTHVYATDVWDNEAKGELNRFYLDNTDPVIESIEITNHSMRGYRVVATVTDDHELSSVQFPTWKNGAYEDTMIWLIGKQGENNTWYVDVVLADHGGEINCTYITHVYATDIYGNQTVKAKNVRVENAAPEFENLACELKDDQTLHITVDIIDRNVLTDITYKVWNEDSSVSGTCDVTEDGNYELTVDLAQLTASGAYSIHFTAKDFWGNTGVSKTIVCTVDTEAPQIEKAALTSRHQDCLRLEMHVTDNYGVEQVQFALCDPDDKNAVFYWMEAAEDDGVWYAEVNVEEAGLINATYMQCHGYAFDACGNKTTVNLGKQAILWSVPDVDVMIPTGVALIEEQAFFNNTSLTGFMIQPGQTVEIGAQAFAGCTNLEQAVMYKNVVAIESGAFEGCQDLTIYCEEDSAASLYAQENELKVRYIEAAS